MLKHISLILTFSLASTFDIEIDSTKVWSEVSPKFLSVAIDSHLIAERWKNFDFEAKKLQEMAKALSPAILRLGGTAADLLYFKEKAKKLFKPGAINTSTNGSDCYCTENGYEDLKKSLYKKHSKFVMTGQVFVLITL